MKFFILFLAIITLALSHLIKVYRWELFINTYEKPNKINLTRSLSLGYLINAFIPFHIGDIFRAIFAGKKMKNGICFSIATVIVDRFLDIFIVSLIFILLFSLGYNNTIIMDSIQFYIIGLVLLIIFSIVAFKYSKFIKIIIKKVSSIFNDNIELNILKIAWFTINSFKDIIRKINKKKLIFRTIIMWITYFISYSLYTLSIKEFGYEINLVNVILSFFSRENMENSSITLINKSYEFGIINLVYLLSSILLLFIISYLFKKSKSNYDSTYLNLIPYINKTDKLSFLEAYFKADNREYFKNYLKIVNDVSIVQDLTAGSNATTLLCTLDNKMFFRKYALESAGEKLFEQVEWINQHKKNIKLTEILNVKHEKGYCCYDMPYYNDCVGFFNYIHSVPIDKSWNILNNVLVDLDKKLYKLNKDKASKQCIEKYINSKVLKNLETIESSKEVKELSKYDELIINGKKYKNIGYFKKFLNYDYLYNIFKNDDYSDIHGDLTIENIICHQSEDDYYIIDPNTGNVHDSCNLDYAKLLQSLHGGYEFLMHTKSVDMQENKIQFLQTRTTTYDELFKKYREFLEKKFTKEQVKSIYYHEIVHWLRLLPYKINRDRKRFIMFYAEFIIVLNEVVEFYEK